MDLTEILKSQEDTLLYSPLFGKVIFKLIDKSEKYFPIVCFSPETRQNVFFTREGYYFTGYKDAECMLFPSKSNRD